MFNTAPTDSPVLLSAFVGRSFDPVDDAVWRDIEDAKQAQLRPVSDKVQEGIGRNDIYVAILTRREGIAEAPKGGDRLGAVLRCLAGKVPKSTRWNTSEWIVEEIGYATGRRHES